MRTPRAVDSLQVRRKRYLTASEREIYRQRRAPAVDAGGAGEAEAPAAAPARPTWARRRAARLGRPPGGWRLTLYTIIFEADTRAGALF